MSDTPPAPDPQDRRVYIPEPEGWKARIKIGWDNDYCYAKSPAARTISTCLLNGEVYIQKEHEKFSPDLPSTAGTRHRRPSLLAERRPPPRKDPPVENPAAQPRNHFAARRKPIVDRPPQPPLGTERARSAAPLCASSRRIAANRLKPPRPDPRPD